MPDPRRQLQAYRQSAATLNFLRALLDGETSDEEIARFLVELSDRGETADQDREVAALRSRGGCSPRGYSDRSRVAEHRVAP